MRGARITAVFIGVLVVFAAGYWAGQRSGLRVGVGKSIASELRAPMPAAPVDATTPAAVAASSHTHRLAGLLDAGAWYQVQRWLSERAGEVTREHGAALRQAIQRDINKFDAPQMRQILTSYLALQPGDIDAQLLLAEVQALSGMRVGALHTYLTVLTQSGEANAAQRARREADAILTALDREHASAGNDEAREALWRRASERYPASDAFRLQWARALAAQTRYDEALRLLVETGDTDVSQVQIDALRTEIEAAEGGAGFLRDGSRLLAHAIGPAGGQFQLLVDTGANITSLSKSMLRAVGARARGEEVRVQTAGGIITTKVYAVSELRVQGRLFENLRVLELPVEIEGLDGLLGLDVIDEVQHHDF